MIVSGKEQTGVARRENGFTLVGLLIIIAIATIMLAAAFPLWTSVVQREKEEELIFRGEAYKQAIQDFVRTFGRPPQKLDELVEMEPRSIRKLYKDPMTEDGEWDLVHASANQMNPRSTTRKRSGPRTGSGQQDQQQGVTDETPQLDTTPLGSSTGVGSGGTLGSSGTLSDVRYRLPGRASNVKMEGGFIIGVQSKSTETSIRLYNGATTYDTWDFSAQLQMGMGIPGLGAMGGGTWQKSSLTPGYYGLGAPGTTYPGSGTTGGSGMYSGSGTMGGYGTYSGSGTMGTYGTQPGMGTTTSTPYGYQGQQPYQTSPYSSYPGSQRPTSAPRRPGFGMTGR